jgi:glycosyltransferase involved in cell wall biosynthesis
VLTLKSKNVSVIISAFNAEKHIAATLDSLLQQTYPNVEIIVVNDGSTDNTLSILESYKAKGVQFFSQENKGQDAALNLGYKYSKGEYVKFMDSDDLINPQMIELQLNAISNSTDYVAYGEWARFYHNNPSNANFKSLDYWTNTEPLEFILARPEGVMLQCGIMLIPRHLIDKVGGWDERLILFNDTEFFNRIILASKGVKFVKGARLYYRSGMASSISAQNGRKYFESTLLAIDLIAHQLLKKEDSIRVRTFIANLYQDRYFQLYPLYPDLCIDYKNRLLEFPLSTLKPQGGKLFNFLILFLGWKITKVVQRYFYSLGYKPNNVQRFILCF